MHENSLQINKMSSVEKKVFSKSNAEFQQCEERYKFIEWGTSMESKVGQRCHDLGITRRALYQVRSYSDNQL